MGKDLINMIDKKKRQAIKENRSKDSGVYPLYGVTGVKGSSYIKDDKKRVVDAKDTKIF